MPKKHKNFPQNGNPIHYSKPKEDSNSSTVFKTLFGEITEQHSSSNSLFSDNNPFRRKLLETRQSNPEEGLGFAGKESEVDGDLRNSDLSELRQKRRKDKDELNKESPNLGDESAEQKGKELRGADLNEGKDEINDSAFDFKRAFGKGKQLLQTAESSDFGVNNEQKKKKKRKRDEIEAEYEAQLYGGSNDMEENKGEGTVLGAKRKKMDNPEDMMVSNEGFDDESKLMRTIFVGNLPLKLKKKEIAKEFSKFGEVESIRIRSVPIADEKIPRKGAVIKKRFNENGDSIHAYIVFKTEESAQASLAHNMTVVGGNHIRVDRACPPRKKLKGDRTSLYDNKRTVFVGNLPFDVKDEEIYKLFTGIKNLESSVEAVRVIRDSGSSLGKGIAYVLFKTTDAANLVAKKRNLRIRDRELRLSFAKSTETTPLKRKSSSQPDTGNFSAKKFAGASRTPDRSNMSKPKAELSYQGLRANKSGAPKKVHTNTKNTSSTKSKSQPMTEKTSWKKKRPAVAARKEKALRQAANSLQSVGAKRKLDNRTPQTGGQKKKARNFK